MTFGMNFYGTTAGPQHTLFGRVVPAIEAMGLAVCRAAMQPLPVVQFANQLPLWVHRIADELTYTVFKEIIRLAPMSQKHNGRKTGRLVGLLIRMVLFYWKQAPAILEREGLTKLTAEQEKKLDKLVGWEPLCAHTSRMSGRPNTTRAQAKKFWLQQFQRFVWHMAKTTWTLTKFALCQPVGEVGEFLAGLAEGFKCFLNADGDFAKTGKRTEVYFALLTYWPEIEEMRQAQPPLARPYVLAWLEKQEGKQLMPSDHAFNELCNDIGLDFGLTGHPFKRPDRQV
jgi:hypothetical protein